MPTKEGPGTNPKLETWIRVQEFAERMEEKLKLNRHKGDWREEDDVLRLFDPLKEETVELQCSMATGTAEEIAKEAADVANFAMMIADWFLCRS
jgi:NTP pyrophosphatase (non-canonical NTP hydrolase)